MKEGTKYLMEVHSTGYRLVIILEKLWNGLALLLQAAQLQDLLLLYLLSQILVQGAIPITFGIKNNSKANIHAIVKL